MGDGKDSDFDPDLKKESSVENLVTLRGSRASIIGDIKRLIKKIDEKLSLNGHFRMGIQNFFKFLQNFRMGIFCLLTVGGGKTYPPKNLSHISYNEET